MVVVCKSKKIEGLNEANIMPVWWHTSHWRKQYPRGISVACNITMASLKESLPDNSLKLYPAFKTWNKTGRPKIPKLIRDLRV
jgi:hypothetical protein